MTYTPAPLMIVVDPLHAQVLAALVSEELLVRKLQNGPPELQRAVLDSHRRMGAQVRWLAGSHQPPGESAEDVVVAEVSPTPLQVVPALAETHTEWISAQAAAKLIGIKDRSVRYAAERGAIASKQDRDGGPLFIDRASAEAYKAARDARERRAA